MATGIGLRRQILRITGHYSPIATNARFGEICIPNNKNIIIGAIYRPPTGNPEELLDKFNEFLSGVTRANKHCYVTGDFSSGS